MCSFTGWEAMEGVMTLADSPTRMRNLLTHEMDAALARHDNDMVNQLLDNAMANHLLGEKAPSIIRSAATQQAQRQLRGAIESGDPKRIKGSLVAAKRHLAAFGAPLSFTFLHFSPKCSPFLVAFWSSEVVNRLGARV